MSRYWETRAEQDKTVVSEHVLLGVRVHTYPDPEGPTWWLSWYRVGIKNVPLVNCLTLREAQHESLARLKVWCEKAVADLDRAISAEEGLE